MTNQQKIEYLQDFGHLVKTINEKLEKEGQTQVNLSTYNQVVSEIEEQLKIQETKKQAKKDEKTV